MRSPYSFIAHFVTSVGLSSYIFNEIKLEGGVRIELKKSDGFADHIPAFGNRHPYIYQYIIYTGIFVKSKDIFRCIFRRIRGHLYRIAKFR